MRARRSWRAISLLFSVVLIGFQGIPAATAADPLDPIIDNGSLVQLGINPEGHLNVPGGTASFEVGTTNVGVRFIPTNGEATAPGCLCEGWGVANADEATGLFSGYANVSTDGGPVNLTVQGGTGVYPGPAGETALLAESVGTRFKSITTAPTPGTPTTDRVRVTQDYHPTPLTANLYQVDVTIENIGTTPIGDLRYRRVMDWDIPPTTFSELVEIHVGTSANLVRATTDGFMSGDPLSDPGPYTGSPPTTLVSGSPDYNGGPSDQGSLWDFKFGALPAGESKTFRIFYGGAPDRTQAVAAINAVGAEMYSFGMPSASDEAGSPPDDGKPNTFIFAFSGVGGTSVSNPQLSPDTATNPLGQQHTLTAKVTNGTTPVAGAIVTFTVLSGPNVGLTGTGVTDVNGNATFSYTSTTLGTDVIEATFADTSGTHHSNRVTKEWVSAATGKITIVKNTTGGDGTFNFTVTGPTSSTPSITTSSGTGTAGPLTVTAGSYSISEASQANWVPTGASCDSGTPASFTVPAGGSVTCTFANTAQGKITIVKNTTGGDGTFNFTVTGPTSSTPSITTSSGTGTAGPLTVTAGSYSISEASQANWVPTGASCDSGTPASFTVPVGGTATCTFNNAFESQGTTLTSLSDAHLWLGLRNSDDQGTQFDVKVELFRNAETTPVASGLRRCVMRLTRNPTFAQDVAVQWDPFTAVSLASGDVLSIRISTRIGTNPDGSKCAGPGGSHNNAVALRFYYDASNRPSRFDTTIGSTSEDLYFHSDGGGCDKPSATRESQNVTTRFLNSTAPTGTLVKCKDSSRLNFAGGNPYAVVGTWSRAPLP